MDMLWYAHAKDPVLEKKTVLVNGQKMITLGEGPKHAKLSAWEVELSILMPVFLFSLVFSSQVPVLFEGDNQLEWNDTFMLYMTTKLSNPKYTPEVWCKMG